MSNEEAQTNTAGGQPVLTDELDEVKPYIDDRYWCESCGAKDGACHPDTGMCWHCGADDWEPHDFRSCLEYFE